MNEAISKLFDHLFSIAQAIVAEGQEHMSMIVVAKEKGIDIMALSGELSKDAIAALHRKVASQGVACLILEAWVHKGDLTDPKSKAVSDAVQRGDVRVADLPTHGEAILFNFRTPTGGQWLAICDIDREAKKLLKGELLDLAAEPHKYGGRFLGNGLSHRNDVN